MSTLLEDAVFLTGLIECDPFYKPETHPHAATVLRVAQDYIKRTASNTPVRGKSALSRDLWWCGNCGRGVGSSDKWAHSLEFMAGSWAFCPKCGQSLDWEKAGFAKTQVSIDTYESTTTVVP